MRGVHDTHGVFHRYKLVTILFTAAEAGQDQCLLAGDEMTAIEFCGHLHGQSATAQTFGDDFDIRGGRKEIPSEGNKHLSVAIAHGANGLHHVQPRFGWWSKTELPTQRLKKCRRGVGGDAHGTVALHVTVPAHRAEAGARFTNVTA